MPLNEEFVGKFDEYYYSSNHRGFLIIKHKSLNPGIENGGLLNTNNSDDGISRHMSYEKGEQGILARP